MPDLTDPTRATSTAIGRRAFAVLSAGAAALAGAAPALAQADAFGRPHPPIVPEDDPAIVTERPTIAYRTADPGGDRTIDSYFAAPKNAGPATPSVVVVQAIWGIDAQLRDVVRRFAQAGYAALAPNLYAGLDAPNGDGATDFSPFRSIASKLADSVVDGDVRNAAYHLKSRFARTKTAVIGFCMGGGIALRQTVDAADVFAAASVFYGKVRYGTTGDAGTITPIALAYAPDIRVPALGSWGARDTSIRADDVRALGAALEARHAPHDFKIYDEAGHAFFDDTRSSYVPGPAADAWARTLAWFAQRLASA
jgi:carboxymethylenebutenolidase